MPGARLSAAHLKLPDPRGVVFFLHGNSGNLKKWFVDLDAFRDPDQLALASPVAAPVPGMAFVVGEVQVPGVPFGDAEQRMALVVVPADEIERIVDVGAAPEPAASLVAVVAPGRVLDLGESLRRRRTPERNEEKPFEWRPGVRAIPGLLSHERHLDVNGNAPGFFRLPGSVIPVRVLAKDLAEIVLPAGRLRGAGGDEQERQYQQPDIEHDCRAKRQHRYGVYGITYDLGVAMISCLWQPSHAAGT